jgi:ATP-dependent exoDNAse (exonuclease V) alpha subunit
MAEGRIQDAVRAYDADGAVYRSAGRETALGALLEDYFKDREAAGPQTTQLAFAHRRTDVFAINQAIRRALRTLDDMQAETIFVTETGPRAFAVGDRIVFTRNDKDIGVKNGMLGTVETVDGGRMSVRLDGDDGASRLVMFDPCRYRSFDHGYAVTIHKSQGATVGRAYVLASRTMDEPLTYVAMTRHQETLRLYLNDEDRPAWAMPENGGPQGRLARARRFEQS